MTRLIDFLYFRQLWKYLTTFFPQITQMGTFYSYLIGSYVNKDFWGLPISRILISVLTIFLPSMWTKPWVSHIKITFASLAIVKKIIKLHYHGPWWWSSSQHSSLLSRRSELVSHWSYIFSVIFFCKKWANSFAFHKHNFSEYNCRLSNWDLNSARQIRRRACWPLDHHHHGSVNLCLKRTKISKKEAGVGPLQNFIFRLTGLWIVLFGGSSTPFGIRD